MTNILTGKFYDVKVGQWFDEEYDYLHLPLLARQNAILLMNPKAEHAKYDYLSAPELHVFQPTDGEHEQPVVDEEGKRHGTIKINVDGSKLTVDVSALKVLPTLYVYVGSEVKEFKLTAAQQDIEL